MTTKNLIPRASGEGGIGITDVTWGYGYYDTGNFNKGLFVKGSGIEDVIANTVTQGGLGGEWTKAVNGLDIYYNAGNVGIGTAVPATALDINKGIGGTAPIITLSRGGNPMSRFGIATATGGLLAGSLTNDLCIRTEGGNIRFGTASATKTDMSILSNGNVGIGTTDPAAALDVADSEAPTIHLTEKTSNYSSRIGIPSAAGQVFSSLAIPGSLAIRNDTKIQLGGVTPLVTINGAGGNVGIGTANPVAELDIHGTLAFKSSGIFINATNAGGDVNSNDLTLTAAAASNSIVARAARHIIFQTYDPLLVPAPDYVERLRINHNGNVGIGTSNPSQKLDIHGKFTINSDGTALWGNIPGGITGRLSWDGGTIGKIILRAEINNTLNLGANGTDNHIVIGTGGNVGIGVTAPAAKLDVLKGGSSQYDVVNDIFRSGPGEHVFKLSTGGWRNASVINQQTGSATAGLTLPSTGLYLNSTYGSKPFTSASLHINCDTGNGDISFLTGTGDAAPTTKVKILNNGDVGIGVTSPGAKLHIQGDDNEIYDANDRLQRNGATLFAYNISSTNGSYSQLVLGNRNNNGSMSRISSVLVQEGTSKLSFSTTKNSTQSESVVISSDGIDIKSRSSQRFCQANWSPGALSSGYSGYINVDSGDNGDKTIQKFVIGAADTWIADGFQGVSIRCASSVQDSFIFKPNGNLYGLNWATGGTISINANGEIVTSSDKRLKNDLGDCEYGLNEVLQLKPKKYTWKDGPKDQKPTIGFFAQDLYGVMEEAGPRTAKLDDKGNSVTDEDGKPDYDWGMNSNAIIAALVNAAKEQQQLIEDLKSRIETLENK